MPAPRPSPQPAHLQPFPIPPTSPIPESPRSSTPPACPCRRAHRYEQNSVPWSRERLAPGRERPFVWSAPYGADRKLRIGILGATGVAVWQLDQMQASLVLPISVASGGGGVVRMESEESMGGGAAARAKRRLALSSPPPAQGGGGAGSRGALYAWLFPHVSAARPPALLASVFPCLRTASLALPLRRLGRWTRRRLTPPRCPPMSRAAPASAARAHRRGRSRSRSSRARRSCATRSTSAASGCGCARAARVSRRAARRPRRCRCSLTGICSASQSPCSPARRASCSTWPRASCAARRAPSATTSS